MGPVYSPTWIYLPYMDPSWVSLSQQLLEVLEEVSFLQGNFYPWTQTKTAGGLLKRTFHRFTAFPPEKSCSARNSLGSEWGLFNGVESHQVHGFSGKNGGSYQWFSVVLFVCLIRRDHLFFWWGGWRTLSKSAFRRVMITNFGAILHVGLGS